MEDLLRKATAVRLGHLHGEISLGNGGAPMGAVAIDPHGAQVNHMHVQTALHNGAEQVMGAVDVVINSVALAGRGLHRVGGCPLLGKMHYRIRGFVPQQLQQPLVLPGQIQEQEADRLSPHLLPAHEPILNRGNGRQGRDAQLNVNFATAEVVDNDHVVSLVCKVQSTGPATKTVTTKNKNLHACLSSQGRSSWESYTRPRLTQAVMATVVTTSTAPRP